jgi:hypothetical protein
MDITILHGRDYEANANRPYGRVLHGPIQKLVSCLSDVNGLSRNGAEES